MIENHQRVHELFKKAALQLVIVETPELSFTSAELMEVPDLVLYSLRSMCKKQSYKLLIRLAFHR